jgi:hypothetical protein
MPEKLMVRKGLVITFTVGTFTHTVAVNSFT